MINRILSVSVVTASISGCAALYEYETYFVSPTRTYPDAPEDALKATFEREPNSHRYDPFGRFLVGEGLVSYVTPAFAIVDRISVHKEVRSKARENIQVPGVARDVFYVSVNMRPRTSTGMLTKPADYRVVFSGSSARIPPSDWSVSEDSRYWTCTQVDGAIEVKGRGCVLRLFFHGLTTNDVDHFSLVPAPIFVDGKAYSLPIINFAKGTYTWM